MTRKQKHTLMLDLVEEHLVGDGELTIAEVLEGVRFVRGRGEAPPWWAEVVYERRAEWREDREEAEP